MNTLIRFEPHEAQDLSRTDTRATVDRPEVAEKLKPARGLVVGLAISLAFWILVAVGVFLAFRA